MDSIAAKLNQKLGPEFISQRPGSSGLKLTYAEGWRLINLANEVFGYNGWSSSVLSITTDYVDFNQESKRFSVGVSALVRVTLTDGGSFHEDIGYGMLENSKSKGSALDKSKKEAVTDGLKRALRNFGNLLGNCLYDKAYTHEIVKLKVPPQKFDVSQLHRPNNNVIEDSKPLSSFPPHIRSEIRSSATSPVTANNKHPITPITPSVQPVINRLATGLNTPITPSVLPPNRPSSTNHHPFTPITPSVLPPANRQQSTSALNKPIAPLGPPDRSAASRHPKPVSHTSAPAPAPAPPVPEQPQQPQPGDADPVATDVNDDADDSFACGSDDDAFFAGLDLDIDIDLGRPIHFEEPPERPTVNRADQQQKQQTRSRLAGPPIQPPPPAPAPPRVPQDQNQKPAAAPAGNANANANQKRPLTPSMGGFHFPPGMAVNTLGPPQPPQQVQNERAHTNASSSSALGLGPGKKRPAEAMAGGGTRDNEARRAVGMGGMGLVRHQQQQQQSGGNVKREPLGALEIGEGGNVKRVRR